MAKPVGQCPNCGAPVEFHFSSAVQTTCPYCQSILVRHDVNLEKVGVVADLPPEVSPIQLLTEGVYRGLSFQVVGRIIYEYELGSWNEWHCVTHQGTSLWLSDAMAQYAITQEAKPRPLNLPAAEEMRPGQRFLVNGVNYEVTHVTKARYRGVQGELPFEYWDKNECIFVDLRTPDARFATIDYSEQPPLVFLGEMVDFDSLRLKHLREFEGW
ncbi:MAG: DUF4178 domain-containing protein [Bryobacteraceae bacterium]|nr:DUF4178 domain-containing protein [Bryobacteraceae bacterium]MDW8379028.1 DUF4178 domain-containing protein [Bryobacterales bacterium]